MHIENLLQKLKIQSRLLQLMTCKDAINSDTSSEDKELYLLEKSRSYNKILYVIYETS